MIPKDKELASICKKCPHLDYYLKTGKSIGIECERAILTNTEHQCRYKPNNSDNMADKKIILRYIPAAALLYLHIGVSQKGCTCHPDSPFSVFSYLPSLLAISESIVRKKKTRAENKSSFFMIRILWNKK